MAFNSKIFLLFPLALVVAVSGCTGGTGIASGPGVVILDFVPELPAVFSNDQVNFLLKVQNQGESRATNVIAEIYNIELSEWGGFGQQQLPLGSLIPADEEAQTPGETQTARFQNLRAPVLAKGIQFSYTPTVRVSYDYTTTGTKPVTIVDSQELVRIQNQGRSLPSRQTTYTAGPLAVDIIMKPFVRTSGTFGSAQAYDVFPVQIVITNPQFSSGASVTPQGFGFIGSLGAGSTYPVLVKVTPPTGTNFIFSGSFGIGGQDCSQFQFPVELFQGRTAEITCELQVSSPPTIATESNIVVDLDYRFFDDQVAEILVTGTRETRGPF